MSFQFALDFLPEASDSQLRLVGCFSEPDYKKSQGSIESEQKPLESDTDSMAEYDDPDTGKFNEDGSFIGQYGGTKRGPETTPEQDTTSPSALSTFV